MSLPLLSGPSDTKVSLLSGLGGDLSEGPWMSTIGCVSWQEVQWKAKFRGVPFAVHTDERIGGRRIHIHEFPGRETWVNEDLGRAKQSVEVEAFVFGDRSDVWAEMLFDRATQEGPALLFLPARVPMMARCTFVSSSWTEDAQGRLNFSLRFTLEPDTGQQSVPTVEKWKSSPYLISAVINSGQSLVNVSRDVFEEDFTGDQAYVGRHQAAIMIQRAVVGLRVAYKQSRTKLIEAAKIEFNLRRMIMQSVELSDSQRTSPDKLTPTVSIRTQRLGRASHASAVKAGLKVLSNPLSGYALRASTNQVIDAIGNPDEGFGGIFLESIRLLVSGSTDPVDLVSALTYLTRLNTSSLQVSVQTSGASSTKFELDLASTVAAFVRRVALVQQTLAILKVTPERQLDASDIRAKILALLNVEMNLAVERQAVWGAFRDLRGAVTDYIIFWSRGGPGTFQVGGHTIRSLAAIAADNYPRNKVEDRDRQIMKINNVRHPLHAQPNLFLMRD